MKRSTTGRCAEDEACRYLVSMGYAIITRNARLRRAEIDIIAAKKDLLVFCEVRSRTGEIYGVPEESLNYKKLNRMVYSALAYAARYTQYQSYRIDAICVVFEDDGALRRLDHYENITS